MRTLTCENCGKNVESALLDGYHFGDRLLEGVMFEVRLVDEKFTASLVEETSYTEGLNMVKWLKTAAKYAETHDVFECPQCHEQEVILYSQF